MHAIRFHNVSKSFSLSGGRKLLRDHLSRSLEKKPRLWALRNVSFQVDAGESVAVIGPNGAGKSTLLSVVTGICAPDEGEVEVNGRVAALLELGSGFHPDLTGAENLRLNASLLGLSRRQADQLRPAVVEFSGIGDFIEQPLRTYSAGMVLRLAFSIAMHVDADLLIVDEILAVGDQTFQAKCRDRIRSFRQAGKTMLCVSHSSTELRKLCDRAIWLDHGQVMLQGEIDDVLEAYEGGARAAASTQG